MTTITAAVVADSVSPSGVRLTTLQLRYPLVIHAELMTHRAFCLDGETELEFDLPSGSKGGRSRRVSVMKLKDFVERWHEGAAEHRSARLRDVDLSVIDDDATYSAATLAERLGFATASNIRGACREGRLKSLNPGKCHGDDFFIRGTDYKTFRQEEMGTRRYSLRSRLQEMQIRQLNETTGRIQTSTVVDCCFSGVKPVYEVQAGDFRVAGSLDHRVLTTEGWRRIGDLKVGIDKVLVRKFGKVDEDRLDPDRLRKIDGVWRSRWQNKVRPTLEEYQGGRCHDCDAEGFALEVHHVEPVYQNPDRAFDEDNVVALCQGCHKTRHSEQGWQGGTYLYAGAETVQGVVHLGDRATYDLEISGEFANFVADGVVVHNSRNASSMRAIPTRKLTEDVERDPYVPLEFRRATRGMEPGEELEETDREAAQARWYSAMYDAVRHARQLGEIGLSKQHANRILTPFAHTNVVVTSTCWDNFFDLRLAADPDTGRPVAQIEMYQLAQAMLKALRGHSPLRLPPGGWHSPYDPCPRISAARCARVSYLTHDGRTPTAEEDLKLYDRLVAQGHYSPLEHQAKAAFHNAPPFLRRNFRAGWEQHRALVEHDPKGIQNHAGRQDRNVHGAAGRPDGLAA